MTRIAVDAMGGDRAPGPEVAGAVAAVDAPDPARSGAAVDAPGPARSGAAVDAPGPARSDPARSDADASDPDDLAPSPPDPLEVVLVGDERAIAAELAQLGAAGRARIEIVHAPQAVTMHDSPAKVFRTKPNSSLRRALEMHARGEVDAVVSAGNSGAVLSHSVFVLRRLPGVERPGIATLFPRDAGGSLVLCDMGANVEVQPRMLAQFGVLGACYDRIVHGRERPRVGVLSNGSEPSKGTQLTREADRLLRDAAPGAMFDYIGYVEGSQLFAGDVDVVATDGFTGNVVLKLAEGLAEAFVRMVRDELRDTLGDGADAAPALAAVSRMKASIDYAQIGGAPLLGVDGAVAVCHGKSDATAIANAVLGAARFARAGVVGRLGEAIAHSARSWA